jgi:Glu-tRNA(Gln) amidotransferase subunit E-like FAD-binding protein
MILAIKLNKFGVLLARRSKPGRRLGTEMSDYAKTVELEDSFTPMNCLHMALPKKKLLL